ncbi:PqqD family protein [Salinibacter grassmerensis]|uniref:PqqD family protein n=1 Tax=Salinibacter grassmerensis TaxID=3040353 RepID=UPI0021E92688|nr:PqqD family protein [Salinibacter grassmerensis]
MRSYRPRSQVVSTTIDEDESVLLHLEAQQYYSLNETGHRIWQLLAQGRDASAIAAAIAAEWATPEAKALRHVRSFLQELGEEGLVEKVPDNETT